MLKRALAGLAPYAAAAVLCLAVLAGVMRLWRARLDVPFCNTGDALVSQVWVENALAGGHYYRGARLGAPYGMDLRDFPASEGLHLAVIRALAAGLKDTYTTINVFFLLTFVLTALSSLYVFRTFGVARLPAVVGGLLYAFLPYHFYRGEGHLFLSGYYLVPLTVQVALWAYLGGLATRGRWAFALAVCALVAVAGVYYAFFGTFFVLLAGLACAVRERRLRPALAALALAGTTGLVLAASLVPDELYYRAEGRNARVAHRYAFESEVYGLKMAQLFLPVSGHRLPPLRRLKELYDNDPGRPLVNDFGSSLGVVGTAGFVLLLGSLLFRGPSPERSPLLTGLGVLLVCGLLLATIGGFGSLFAFLVSPQIRCYDRLSIFLGFFALFGVVWALDRLAARVRGPSWRRRLAAYGLSLLVLTGGLGDQTTPANVPPYAELKREYQSLAEFTGQIEQTLPPGAMVLQLPYCPFPESGPCHEMASYDHFRLFMHSRTLRWSHGAVSGRYGAAVLDELTRRPIDEALDPIAAMGYGGIHIDRRGYADGGQQLEARLRYLLGSEPLVSRDGRDVFFDLRAYAERRRQECGAEEWRRRESAARFPAVVLWGRGFWDEETKGPERWRWCAARGELQVVNPSGESRRLTIRFGARTCSAGPARLVLSGPLLNEVLTIGTEPRPFRATLDVPPGKHVIALACDGREMSDAVRSLSFALCDFEALSADEK